MRSKLELWATLTCVIFFTLSLANAQDINTSSVKRPSESEFRGRPFAFRGDWKVVLGGSNTQEAKDTASAGFLFLTGHLDLKLNSMLNIHVEPMTRLYGGRAQQRWDDDTLESRVGVADAHLSFQPVNFLELKGGVHSQTIVDEPMLVSGLRSFYGAQEILKAEAGEFKGRLIFQQVVPNSYSLNTEREKQETLPWFKTQHAEIEGHHFGWFEWKAKGGLYQWSDIPSKVVFESIRQGNSGDNSTVPTSRFYFAHQGWFAGGSVCYCGPGNLGWVVDFKRIHNNRAPGDAADAQMWGLGPNIKWNGMELALRYHSYFIESDATIAGYNKSRLGNTNRVGEHLAAKLRFADQHFSLFGEMYRAKPINDRDVEQKNMEQYYFGVETDYVSF